MFSERPFANTPRVAERTLYSDQHGSKVLSVIGLIAQNDSTFALKVAAIYTTGSAPDSHLPSDILYGSGVVFQVGYANRFIAIATGYENKFAIGWGESVNGIAWRHITVY